MTPISIFEEIAKIHKPNETFEMGGILYFLIKLIGAKRTLETGVGYTTLIMASASPEHWAIEKEINRCERIEREAKELNLNLNIINDWTENIKWSQEIDLLFLDASHKSPRINKEIEIFSPYVRKDGLMCFHDSYHYNDVKKVVDNLPRNKWEVVTIPYSSGFTICRKIS